MRAERATTRADSRVIKLLLCSLAGPGPAMTVATAALSQAPPTVRVDSGELQGVVDDGVVSFKGIPFAAPPVGELRWRPPQPAAKWTGVRQATEFGASCMQGRGLAGRLRARVRAPVRLRLRALRPLRAPASARLAPPPPAGAPAAQAPSEDCLYLNVWRPADPAARNLPVMVWIYGGGFTGGSSSSPNTSGVQFAKQGVVLVAMNYRVGRFGFFAFPALEQRASRRDQGQLRLHGPDRGLAVGEAEHRRLRRQSEQRHHLWVLRGWRLRSQHAGVAAWRAGLFHKAIVESGGSRDSVLTARPMRADGVDPNYPVSAETIGINFAKSMGIEGTDQAALAKLRGLSADEVLRGAPPQPGATCRPTRRRRFLTAN